MEGGHKGHDEVETATNTMMEAHTLMANLKNQPWSSKRLGYA